MRKNTKEMRRKVRLKRRIVSLVGLLIIAIVGITIFSGNEKDTINTNAQILKPEEPTQPEDVVTTINNSGYLLLNDDPNADDSSIVLPETMHQWNFYNDEHKKTVYLTFDDGPSTKVTTQILDILDANDVKGTFFVLGREIDENPKSEEILKRMAKEGHAIANHGYSHDYNKLYPGGVIDVQAFMADMDKNLQLLKSKLGSDFDTRVLRMPGGYGTWYGVTPLNEALSAKGYYQTDWNVVNGDAEGSPKNAEQQLQELKNTLLDYDTAIVLMHDTNAKVSTVEYLQSAIDYLKAEGYEFKTLK